MYAYIRANAFQIIYRITNDIFMTKQHIYKVSTLLLGKKEFTIKGNLKLESRNSYLRFDGKGMSSSFTSSFGEVAFESSSFLKG